jgi:hypothetical protein
MTSLNKKVLKMAKMFEGESDVPWKNIGIVKYLASEPYVTMANHSIGVGIYLRDIEDLPPRFRKIYEKVVNYLVDYHNFICENPKVKNFQKINVYRELDCLPPRFRKNVEALLKEIKKAEDTVRRVENLEKSLGR